MNNIYTVDIYRSELPNSIPLEPKRRGDVGYDLYVCIDRTEQSWLERVVSKLIGERCLIIWPIVGVKTIHSGIHLVMPDSIWCEVRPRSSTSRKKLNVLGGTIDSGYHGPMFTVLHNLGFIPRIILEGERYAQAVFRLAIRPHLIDIDGYQFNAIVRDSINRGGRAMDGFGSTGQ